MKEGLVPYRNIERNEKQRSQAEITMYFHEVIPCVRASLFSPATFTSSASAPTPARPAPPLPSPQPPQDYEGQDIYDNLLPLSE